MWNDAPANSLLALLLKGCMGGAGLGVTLLLIGGGIYFVLSVIGMPHNLVLLLSIASGPVIGTLLAAVYALMRPSAQPPLDSTSRRRPSYFDDEDT
jgi:hypothetical protein